MKEIIEESNRPAGTLNQKETTIGYKETRKPEGDRPLEDEEKIVALREQVAGTKQQL